MKAQGEHILVQVPRKRDTTEKGIILPDDVGKTFQYGVVLSIGSKARQELPEVEEGSVVTFDVMGARELLLDSLKDDGRFVLHCSQVFTTVDEKELISRTLPIPK